MIILAKLPLSNLMKNNSHWKFKAQHNHTSIVVSVCLKYGLLTDWLWGFFAKRRKKKPTENPHTFGKEETISKTFHTLLCLKGSSETSDLVWKSVPADSEVDNPLSLKEREIHIKNFTPKPLKTTLKQKRRGRKKNKHNIFIYLDKLIQSNKHDLMTKLLKDCPATL